VWLVLEFRLRRLSCLSSISSAALSSMKPSSFSSSLEPAVLLENETLFFLLRSYNGEDDAELAVRPTGVRGGDDGGGCGG